ncbi:MAG: RNA polymerase sporulation sigma factor SigK [Clostridia bacterium]|nr:RNA polymerase sporulation sigma factor SigK [Clostridia bacterium]
MLNLYRLLLRFISLILGLDVAENFPPPLSPSEERELFLRMRNGDASARTKIIEHNLRLVSHIIRKYYASYGDQDELLSIGSLGLIKAVDSYKSEVGTRFATYGARCIQNEILMFFRSRKKASHEVSINETIDIDKDGNPLTYLDIMSTEDTMAEDIEMEGHIRSVRALVDERLTGREREIIILRFGLMGYEPKTQREVAKHLGISRSYVSRIEKKALETLRLSFGKSRPDFSD